MNIPKDIKPRFDSMLLQKKIPEKYHNFYRKWLMYYLDFCRKYDLPKSSKDSLPHYLKKLQDENQTVEQRKQASHGLSLYYLVASGAGDNKYTEVNKPDEDDHSRLPHVVYPGSAGARNNRTSPHAAEPSPEKEISSEEKVAGWNKAIDDLKGEIRCRK